MINRILPLVAAILFSTGLWANESSICEGKLPWQVPGDPDGSGAGSVQAEVTIVLNNEDALETVICLCEGEKDSYVTVVNRDNDQTRLYLDGCVLVTDTKITLHNGNSQPASGGFSKYPVPVPKPESE